jgi:two-component system nitrate/nitrite response regulator NarL
MINVLVADHHPVVVRGIRGFLKSARDVRIVATCSDGNQAIKLIRELEPVVAIVGIDLPKASGFDVLATIQREKLPTRVLFFTGSANPRDIVTAMADGAYGFLRKDAQPYELLFSVREIAAGRKCLPFELFDHLIRDNSPIAPRPIEKLLTRREWKVMELAAKGLSNKDIARRLDMSPGTAKIHLYNIFKKVGVKNRSALANLTFRSSSIDNGRQ